MPIIPYEAKLAREQALTKYKQLVELSSSQRAIREYDFRRGFEFGVRWAGQHGEEVWKLHLACLEAVREAAYILVNCWDEIYIDQTVLGPEARALQSALVHYAANFKED